MAESFRIKDFMNPNPVTVSPETNIADVTKLTLKNKISGVLVVDQSKKLLGMISELDCLRVMSDSIYHDGCNTSSLTAKDVMTKEVTQVSPDADLFDVMVSMLNQRQRRRPVVENGKVIGQVTCRQLLKVISSYSCYN